LHWTIHNKGVRGLNGANILHCMKLTFQMFLSLFKLRLANFWIWNNFNFNYLGNLFECFAFKWNWCWTWNHVDRMKVDENPLLIQTNNISYKYNYKMIHFDRFKKEFQGFNLCCEKICELFCGCKYKCITQCRSFLLKANKVWEFWWWSNYFHCFVFVIFPHWPLVVMFYLL